MNILFPITGFYPSLYGGPNYSVYVLAKGLAKAGAKVSVLTTSLDIDPGKTGIVFDRWEALDGMRVYYKKMRGATPLPIDLEVLFTPGSLLSILRSNPWDIMHLTMFFTMLSHLSAAFCLRENIPYFWSPRGATMPNALPHGSWKKRPFLSVPSVRNGILGAHYHAASNEEARSIVDFFRLRYDTDIAPRVTTIPNMVEDETFLPTELPRRYEFPYILYLGRIHPLKNIEALIAGYADSAMHDRVKLVIAGWTGEDPAYTAMLKKLVGERGVGERVVFTETRVKGEEKRGLYRDAELFVLPSHSENFGMVVLEALAQGCPVAASKNTPWQILEKSAAGYWIKNTPSEIATTINHVLAQSIEWRHLLRKRTKTLAEEYSNEKVVSRYIAMYERILTINKGGK